MPEEMTSRQRMLAAIHFQAVDRVPVAPWGLGRVPETSALGQELLQRTDPWMEVGMGCRPVLGADVGIGVTRRGDEERHTIQAGERTLSALWRTTAETRACMAYYCRNAKDIEALLTLPYRQPAPDVEAFQSLRERVGERGLCVMCVSDGLCFVSEMLGSEYCSYLWADRPDLVCELVSLANERTMRVVESACRGGVDAFRIIGGEYASQVMGPRAWRELVLPYDAQLITLMHSYGALVHYHNHGNMRDYIVDIAEMGADSVDPIEQPPYGDLEMSEARRLLGDRLCLVGGLDDMEILEKRPRSEVLAIGRRLLREAGTRGYMLGGTSSGIYGERAARSFLALAELAGDWSNQKE